MAGKESTGKKVYLYTERAACSTCGREFDARVRYPRPLKRYCSRACYSSRPRKGPTHKCEHCGVGFVPVAGSRGRFCSKACCDLSRRSAAATGCEVCGVRFTYFQWLNGRPSVVKGRRKTCSPECAGKLSGEKLSKIVGPMRPAWKGGLSSNHSGTYRGPGWVGIAREVRARDGHKCMSCGMTNAAHKKWCGQQLEVHHKVPFHNFTDYRKANRKSNLETLCIPCHRKADAAVLGVQLGLAFKRAGLD